MTHSCSTTTKIGSGISPPLEDQILFDSALWGGGAKTADEILSYAIIKNGNAVFSFGDGNKLVLDDITDLSLLTDAIDFY